LTNTVGIDQRPIVTTVEVKTLTEITMGAQQSSRRITVVNDEASGVIKISDSVVNRLKEEIEGANNASQKNKEPEAPLPVKESPPPLQEAQAVHEAPPAVPEIVAPVVPVPEVAAPIIQEDVQHEAPVIEPVTTVIEPTIPAIEHVTPIMQPDPPAVQPSAPIPQPVAAVEQSIAPTIQPIAPQVQSLVTIPAQEPRPQRPIIHYVEEPSLSSLKIRAEKEKELNDLDDHWRKRMQEVEQDKITMSNLQAASIAMSVKELEDVLHYEPVAPVCTSQRNMITKCLKDNKGKPLNCGDYVKEFSNCANLARLSFLERAG